MGTFLRFKRCAKSFNSTPVSIPSRINVLEFDSLTRGHSNTLFNRGIALVVRFWLNFLSDLSGILAQVCIWVFLVLWQWLGCCCCFRQKKVLENLWVFFWAFVISCVRKALYFHLPSTWRSFCCIITLFMVSQVIKTWKLNAAFFTRVSVFESCCTVFFRNLIVYFISWFS